MATESDSHLPTLEDLDRLSADALIAYTSRIALRALPLMGVSGQIDIWDTKARPNMDALFAANLIAIFRRHPLLRNGTDEIYFYTVRTSRHALNAIVKATTVSAQYPIKCAIYSNRAIFGGDSQQAFDATDTTRAYLESKPAPFKDAFTQATLLDYHFLHARTLKIEDSREINALYFEPLFINQKINYEEWLKPRAIEVFKSIDGSEYLEFFANLFDGKIHIQKCIQWLKRWIDKNVDNEGSGFGDGQGSDGNLDGSGGPGDAADAWFSNNQPSDTRFPRKPIIATTATDAPALEDRLGREALVESLAAMLANKGQDTPMTIGLFGHWGAGKTSFMAQLQKKLSEPSQKDDLEFLFSWFNAWEYENTENVAAGLAEEVIAGLLTDGQFYRELGPPYTKKTGLFKRLGLRLGYLWTAKKTELIIGLALTLVAIAIFWIGIKYRVSLENFIPYFGQTLSIFSFLALIIFFLKRIVFLWQHPLTVELKTFFKLPSYKKELGEIPEIRDQLTKLCKLRLQKISTAKRTQNSNEGRDLITRFLERNQTFTSKDKEELLGKSISTTAVKSLLRIPIDLLLRTCAVTKEAFTKERRLVVFIDDLDRCRVQTIAKTFDATRLITHIKNVIVIIGIDERIAFQAMARSYQNYASQERSKEAVARDYLGKIIQLPIILPEVSTDAVSSYIQDFFKQKQPSADSQNTEATQLAENEQPRQGSQNADATDIREPNLKQEPTESIDTKSGPSKRPATQPEPESSDGRKSPLPESEEEIEAFKILSSLFSISNPRQLLRLRNAYRLLKAMYSQTTSQIDETLSPLHMSVVLFYKEYCATEDGNNRLEAPTKILERLPSIEQKWGKSATILIAEDFLKYEAKASEPAAVKHWYSDLKEWVKICILPSEKAPNQAQVGQGSDA